MWETICVSCIFATNEPFSNTVVVLYNTIHKMLKKILLSALLDCLTQPSNINHPWQSQVEQNYKIQSYLSNIKFWLPIKESFDTIQTNFIKQICQKNQRYIFKIFVIWLMSDGFVRQSNRALKRRRGIKARACDHLYDLCALTWWYESV